MQNLPELALIITEALSRQEPSTDDADPILELRDRAVRLWHSSISEDGVPLDLAVGQILSLLEFAQSTLRTGFLRDEGVAMVEHFYHELNERAATTVGSMVR